MKHSVIETRRSFNDEHKDTINGINESTCQDGRKDEDKGKYEKTKSRNNLIGQLKQMAAAQSEKVQKSNAAIRDLKCKVIKNSSMNKGRTSTGRMEPRTMGEAQVHGSTRSDHLVINSTSSARHRGSSTLRASSANAAIARLLQKGSPT